MTRKKSLTSLFIVLLTLIIASGWYFIIEKGKDHYDVSKLAPSYFNATENDLIYMTAVKSDYSYRSKYIEIVLTNDSDNPIQYGYMYRLETFIDGKWYKVPMRENHVFPLVGIGLDENSSTSLKILLDDYQCLPGKHRIIKEVRENGNEVSIAVEFNLS